jgi:tetratricopeptide (TPR) repeat protein
MASMLAALLGPGSALASESVPVVEQEIPLAAETEPAADPAQQPDTEYGSPFAEVDQYFDAIDRIEAEHGPYATELSDLYLGLGQSLMDSGDFEQARDAFQRSVMVLRVNSGPNSPEQTNHLYLIANIETLLGDSDAAEDVIENIHFINSNYYSENYAELMPALERIYQWLVLTRPPGSEIADHGDYRRFVRLAEEMAELSETTNGPSHPDTAAAYRRLGEALFQLVWFLGKEQENSYVAFSSEAMELPAGMVVPPSGEKRYEAGRRAFNKYLEAIRQDESSAPLDYPRALLDLGDWYLALGKSRIAARHYEEAYQTLVQTEEYAERAKHYLGVPQPVHFADMQPHFLTGRASELEDMRLDVSMTVTSLGEARYVEVLDAPEVLSEEEVSRIERHVRETPFRPAIRDGRAVTLKEFIWQYVIELPDDGQAPSSS